MKYSKIALATSMALAAMSSQAASTGIPNPVDNVVFISGASGIDGYMKKAAPSFLDTTSASYRYVHTGATTDDLSWYGPTKVAIGTFPIGTNLLIIKRSKGSSAMGVVPLARSQKVQIPDVWSSSATSVSATEYTVPLVSADSLGLVPDIGVSDVEPKMFTGINAENGYSPLTAAEQGTLTSAAWAQLAEGIVATRAVPETAVLSDAWIRGALSNAAGYADWKKVTGVADDVIICRRIEGSGTQAAYNSYFNGFPNTQAYAGYLKTLPAITTDSQGYDGNHAGTSADPILIDPTGGYTVFEGDGSGEVRKCLQAAQLQQDVMLLGRNGLQYKLQFSYLAAPGKAIGTLSLDSYTKVTTNHPASATAVDGNGYAISTADTNGEWTFRNLHGAGTYDVKNKTATCSTSPTSGCSTDSGIAPSRANLLNSSYDFTVEPTIQMRSSGNRSIVTSFYNVVKPVLMSPADMMEGSAKNSTPLAYVALPGSTALGGVGITKSATPYTGSAVTSDQLIADMTRQGNTTALLHPVK